VTSDQSVKADAGKARWGLVPWAAVKLLADVVTFGATKYGDGSWRRVEVERYHDALHRHLHAWRCGEQNDPDSGLPHLAHALCNVAFMLELTSRRAPAKLTVVVEHNPKCETCASWPCHGTVDCT